MPPVLPVAENRYLVVQMKAGGLTGPGEDLADAARNGGFGDLIRKYQLGGRRLISSVPLARLAELERRELDGEAAMKPGLADYWRLDARRSPAPLSEIAAALQAVQEVGLVYCEPGVRDSAFPSDDPLSSAQRYLDPAPVGVGARWFWEQPHGDGEGMQFVDLEQGWLRDHEDLPPYELLCGDNRDGSGYVGDHGAAVLGIVAGVDNDRGVIGMAPRASVRIASHWRAKGGGMHVANALAAAAAATPRPHVILLEVETDEGLPVETDPAVRDLIRCAVAAGIVVVQAAGNGGKDLDQWSDPGGKQRLNRSSPDFIDSGAIFVAAARSALPHDKILSSCWGSRIDCYAWGEKIVTAGGWRTDHAGSGYTDRFNATSGASAIVAGCAVLLQGRAWNLGGALLSPQQMRGLLSDPATGTPGSGAPEHIGVMPDLQAIVQGAAANSPLSGKSQPPSEPFALAS